MRKWNTNNHGIIYWISAQQNLWGGVECFEATAYKHSRTKLVLVEVGIVEMAWTLGTLSALGVSVVPYIQAQASSAAVAMALDLTITCDLQ